MSKLHCEFTRVIKSDPHKNTGIAGWNGAQYIFEGGRNGRGIVYQSPEELSGLIPAKTGDDPQKVSDYLQGVELVFAGMVKDK